MWGITGLQLFLTTCHCPSLIAFPPLVTLNVCWFLNWTSMRPPLSPNMNHESWEDSAYSTTPSGSNVRKSNSAANLAATQAKTEIRVYTVFLMYSNVINHTSFSAQYKLTSINIYQHAWFSFILFVHVIFQALTNFLPVHYTMIISF